MEHSADTEIVEKSNFRICLCLGKPGSVESCVGCKAKAMNAGPKATAVFIYRDKIGNITDIEEVWIN